MPGLNDPVTCIPGVGPRRAETLAEAGIQTLRDLLWHLPRRYQDRRTVTPLAEVREPGVYRVQGKVENLGIRRLGGRRSVVSGRVRDETGELDVVWFNQPWLVDRLDLEALLDLAGEVRPGPEGEPTLTHPDHDEVEEAAGGIRPVYPAIGSLSSGRIADAVGWVLDHRDLRSEIDEDLPPACRRRHDLPDLAEALATIHRPGDDEDPGALERRESRAHARLIYGELFSLQRRLAHRASSRAEADKGHRYRIDEGVRARAREMLPFRLTGAQRRVVGEIAADLTSPSPMRRLLQGDVGSGKTIVAALALLLARESGLQGALLAPTELLAEQHARSLRRLFGEEGEPLLLTGGRAGGAERRAVERGEARLVVGTHALLDEGLSFYRLGLAIVDEQHRFGVVQREVLVEKGGGSPDLLVMSATPIPRSLALTVYGDLDVSVLDELPPGRRRVETAVYPATDREAPYRRLRSALGRGDRGFVVFPVIGDTDDPPLGGEGPPSLLGLGERIRRRLADVPTGMVHGRMTAEERDRVMEGFRRGEVRLLLATSIVEVGVDVPEARFMVIEGAERFGLAQLHQLRGRVGRGDRSAWCAAIHGPLTDEGRLRMEAFAATDDGFEIADRDLAIRGPGELLGERQAGAIDLGIADPVRHRRWLDAARRDARAFVFGELDDDVGAGESEE